MALAVIFHLSLILFVLNVLLSSSSFYSACVFLQQQIFLQALVSIFYVLEDFSISTSHPSSSHFHTSSAAAMSWSRDTMIPRFKIKEEQITSSVMVAISSISQTCNGRDCVRFFFFLFQNEYNLLILLFRNLATNHHF